jgi:hypothetical protein
MSNTRHPIHLFTSRGMLRMKRTLSVVRAVLLLSPMAFAANSVVMGSKPVALSATGVTIGVALWGIRVFNSEE